MNTKQTNIRTTSDKSTSDKIKIIAKNNNRSISKEVDYIIKKYINEYESQNGDIKIEDE